MKLVDTLEEQEILEDLLEETKPPYPKEADGFNYLMATPFRYFPYPNGSRFRRAGQRDGAYYSSIMVESAIAEMSFYKMLFFSHASGMSLPETGAEHTAIATPVKTDRAIDLSLPPFDKADELVDKADYRATQDLADAARAAGAQIIISQSVRCPIEGLNVTVLDLEAFTAKKPTIRQTWKLHVKADRVIATCEFPRNSLEFVADDFKDDRLNLA